MLPRGRATPLLALLLAALAAPALASCRGNSCPRDESSAAAAGLLGSGLQGACVPQQYPKQGALLPVTLQGRIINLVWPSKFDTTPAAEAPKTVLALVADIDGFPGGPLWRSDYHGKADSWKDATPALAAALPSNETASHVGVANVVWHPSRPERLFLLGRGRWHWTSPDGGATFAALRSPGGTLGAGQEIKPHPSQPDWLLAKVRRDACIADYRSEACGHDLFVSKDFGASWANLTEASGGKMAKVRDFEWGAVVPRYAGQPTPDEAVFATVLPGSKAHKEFYPGWDKDIHYVVTLDLFATPFAKIVPCGNLFEVVGHKIFLAVPSECPVGPDGKARKSGGGAIGARSVTLYASNPEGSDFAEVCLPARLEDDGYNLIHTHDGAAAFVLADHAEPGSWGPTADSPTSDAYAPAYNVSLHTMSLSDVYRRDYVTDFSRVEGLPGLFIANQVDPAGRTPGSRGKEASFLRTRLSTNGGAGWGPLAPPASFRFGHCNTCPPGAAPDACSLHLHGPTSWFAPEGPHPNFYSVETAPGLVIATGNVGPHLDMSPDADCTWLSRDGGLTWEDVAENTAIYEIGRHGGLVVLASHASEGPTDAVTFSLDAGACFHKVQLPEPLLVDNIRVAPGGNSAVFLVHGSACLKTAAHPACGFTGGASPPGKMYAIDLQELMGSDWKECSADEGSEDFEGWTVPAQEGCLLGTKRALRRRNRGAFCVTPAGFDPQALAAPEEPCDCGPADVECEFGFVRGGGGAANATCAAIPDLGDACPRLTNSGYLASSSHLRLVHGNTCRGVNGVIPDTNGRGGAKGVDPDAGGGKKKHCGGGSAVKSFFIFVLAAGAAAVAAGLAWTHCLAPEQRAALADRAAPALGVAAAGFEMALGLVVEAYDWTRAKLRAVPFLNRGGAGAGLGASFGYGDGAGAGYEPLTGSGGLDLDPEDHRSPPLVAQGGAP